jgi:hypothetical protein
MAISRRIIKFFQAKVAVDKVDSELVQIQTANELLRKHKKLIDSIYHQSHVPKEHFKKLYLYSIERLADTFCLHCIDIDNILHHSHLRFYQTKATTCLMLCVILY